jgi:hypothetical protein
MRWLLVEAAEKAGLSPLRLSYTEARREVKGMWPTALASSAAWVGEVLQGRLLQRLASHVVVERPCRQYPRSKKERKRSKREADRRANKAKPRRQQKTKERRWYGQGWDLSGPKPKPDTPPQG